MSSGADMQMRARINCLRDGCNALRTNWAASLATGAWTAEQKASVGDRFARWAAEIDELEAKLTVAVE